MKTLFSLQMMILRDNCCPSDCHPCRLITWLYNIVIGEFLESKISFHPTSFFQKSNERLINPSTSHGERLRNGQTCYFPPPIMLHKTGRICSRYAEKKEERQHSQRAPIGRGEYQMFVAWKCLQLEALSAF